MSGNVCYKWNPDGTSWKYCQCASCRARQRAAINKQFKEFNRNSKKQDSRKVHDTKGRNTQGRSLW